MFAALILALATTLSGVVHDSSGGVVSGAAIVVRAGGSERRTTTGQDGRFSIDVAEPGEVTVTVLAGGFAEANQKVTDFSRALDFTLKPAALLETVTVTPSRSAQITGDVPASVNILDSTQIRQSPAVVADDVLRQIPTFSLFRRSSSLSTHPTSQGVSLRGIGPSGVSRTLVMQDGTPVNDPFGGWVYWTRVPLETVDRIEVVDNSSSSLYGNYAMGGVINIVSARPERRTVDLKAQGGNNTTGKIDVSGSDVYGKFGIRADAAAYNTDGFYVVAQPERGVIDNNATVKFKNFNVKLDYNASDNVKAFFRTGYFSENRGNGKINEINDTQWTSWSGGVRAVLRDSSELQGTIYGDIENFHSTFMAVPGTTPPRNTVRLSVDQHVPTDAVGGLVQWSKAINTSNFFSAGTDLHWVDGDSNEANYNATGPVLSPVQAAVLALNRVSGGTQRSAGVFAQDLFTPLSNLTVTLGGAGRSLAELRPAQSRNRRDTGDADQQPAGLRDHRRCAAELSSGPQRHHVQSEAGRALPVHPGGQRVGRHRQRLPCADTERAVPAVPRRDHPDARQLTARPRDAQGRRARRHHFGAAQHHRSLDLVRQSDHEPGGQRDDIDGRHRHHPAAAEPRLD